MKSILLVTLSTFLIFTTSCSKNEVIQDNQTEGVKSFTDNVFNSEDNTNYNHLSEEKITILNSKDEIDLSNEVLKHINNYRNSIGLKRLINNATAKNQALSHSDYQAKETKMSHEHSSKRAATLFSVEEASFYGENVAYGYTNIEKLVTAWIKSESHRKNIEGDFTYSGVGTIANDRGVLYFTQIFFK